MKKETENSARTDGRTDNTVLKYETYFFLTSVKIQRTIYCVVVYELIQYAI